MCSYPAANEILISDTVQQCPLCAEVFPFVNILSCRRLKGGEVPVCLTCHQRLHPACTMALSVLEPSHYQCRVCHAKRGMVVCALCSMPDSKDEVLEGVLMCEECSEQIHGLYQQHHSDHFYPVASPAVVAVKGPIQWHNFVDVRCEISAANHNAPRIPPPPAHRQLSETHVHQHGVHVPGVSNAKQRDHEDVKRVGSRTLLYPGGNIVPTQSVKRKYHHGGYYERFARTV